MDGPMEQKTSSNNEKRILVVSISFKEDDGLAYGVSRPPAAIERTYRFSQFSSVDLDLGKLVPDYAPSMLQFCLPTSVLPFNNSLYVFGGSTPAREKPCHRELLSHPPKSHQKIFVGGSRLRLDLDSDGWCPVPKPIENPNYPTCVSLFNKFYVFGSGLHMPEVLDPTDSCWKPLTVPPDLVGCALFYDPHPDPSNNRILLPLLGGKLPSPSIYAFTPTDDGGTWKLVTRCPEDWFEVALLADDVIYFSSITFDGVIRAFDIQSGEWLKAHWVSKFEKGVNMNKTRMEFDALFQLGDKILCLAGWSPTCECDESGSRVSACDISFFKFRVERSGSTVNLIPLSSHSFLLPATCSVQMFVPF